MDRSPRSVRSALAAGLLVVLAAGALGLVPPRLARADTEGDGIASGTATLTVTCGSTPSTLRVDAWAEPAVVVDGGSLDVRWTLRWDLGDASPRVGPATVGLPVPAAAALVHDVEAVPRRGAAMATASVVDDHVLIALTPDGASAEVVAEVRASVDLRPGIAPTVLGLAPPDVAVMGSGAAGPADEGCRLDGPTTALVEVAVVSTPSTTPPTAPPTTEPPTTVPPTTTTTLPWGRATTTTPPVDRGAGGDTPAAEPLAPADTPVVPLGPRPASRIVTQDLEEARAAVAAARSDLAARAAELAALEDRVARLERRLHHLEVQRRALDRKLRHRARELDALLAATYVEAVDAVVTPSVPDDGTVSLATALDAARRTFDHLLEREAEVLAQVGEVARGGADGLGALGRATTTASDLRLAVANGRLTVATLRNGGDFVVTGFRFPVAGPHDFTDTWHAPRSGGRLHQGTDVFAPEGTPLRAVERGVVTRLGTDVLGGTKLWLVGESGTQWYYAHLRNYAPGLADGQVVEAGAVIGYVGHTGNARTTPFHLHFEAHPAGGDAVDAYPLLLAADGSEQGGAGR